jgi:hypothetical protein
LQAFDHVQPDDHVLMQQMLMASGGSGDPNGQANGASATHQQYAQQQYGQQQQPDMDRDIAITLAELLDDFNFVNAANKSGKAVRNVGV